MYSGSDTCNFFLILIVQKTRVIFCNKKENKIKLSNKSYANTVTTSHKNIF